MVLHAGAGAGAGAGPKVVLPIVAPHLHLPRTGGEVTPPPPPPPPPSSTSNTSTQTVHSAKGIYV